MNKEYRCTIADLYPNSCPVEDRQGYYVIAKDAKGAIAKMKRKFPEYGRFTVHLWQENI